MIKKLFEFGAWKRAPVLIFYQRIPIKERFWKSKSKFEVLFSNFPYIFLDGEIGQFLHIKSFISGNFRFKVTTESDFHRVFRK